MAPHDLSYSSQPSSRSLSDIWECADDRLLVELAPATTMDLLFWRLLVAAPLLLFTCFALVFATPYSGVEPAGLVLVLVACGGWFWLIFGFVRAIRLRQYTQIFFENGVLNISVGGERKFNRRTWRREAIRDLRVRFVNVALLQRRVIRIHIEKTDGSINDITLKTRVAQLEQRLEAELRRVLKLPVDLTG